MADERLPYEPIEFKPEDFAFDKRDCCCPADYATIANRIVHEWISRLPMVYNRAVNARTCWTTDKNEYTNANVTAYIFGHHRNDR